MTEENELNRLEDIFPVEMGKAQLVAELEFRRKIEEHKKKHPCCIHPEVCVTFENAPKTVF
jgi:hypothetical protein